MVKLTICLVAFSFAVVCYGIIPTVDVVDQARNSLLDAIRSDPTLIGGAVRLIFHDCVGNGKCDGCIDHTNKDNAGLERYTTALENVFQQFQGSISRADFWALAAIVAAEVATGDEFEGFFELKYGRKDCIEGGDGTETQTDEILPGAHFNIQESAEYFEKEFGLTIKETVTLLGAHSLGRARKENSGYVGKWVRTQGGENILDNEFYKEILRPWEQVELENPTVFQWQDNPPTFVANTGAPGDFMLLNADVSLAFDIDVDSDGRSACSICPPGRPTGLGGRPCCLQHTHASYVTDYANNNVEFIIDFTDVFLKMMNINDGLSGLETPTTTSTTTTTTPTTTTTTTTTTPTTTQTTPTRTTKKRRPFPPRQPTGRRQDSKIQLRYKELFSDLKRFESKLEALKSSDK